LFTHLHKILLSAKADKNEWGYMNMSKNKYASDSYSNDSVSDNSQNKATNKASNQTSNKSSNKASNKATDKASNNTYNGAADTTNYSNSTNSSNCR